MKNYVLMLVLILIAGCAYKVIPLKGSYSNGIFEGYSDKSREEVWDNMIEFFAKSGISIKLIDRASGLIISERTNMTWTYEDSKGQLEKPNAWIVIEKSINPANKMPLSYAYVSAEWNIRIKEQGGRTLININLVSPIYKTLADQNPVQFEKKSFQSTEVFEKMLYNQIK